MAWTRWVAIVVLAAGCSTSSEPHDLGLADTSHDLLTVDAPADAAADVMTFEIVDTGAIFVDACQAFNSRCQGAADANCGKCQYRIMYDGACTAQQPCDDLVLYWSNLGCEEIAWQQSIRRFIGQARKLIIACVQPLYPGEVLPASLGAPERENALVPLVLARLTKTAGLGVWSGKNLLMAGCSMGATRYPVVAARYPADAQWQGSAKSAVCMSDGVVDVVEQDRFIAGGAALGGQSCAARHGRIVTGYTNAQAVPGHGCQDSPGGQCACDPNHASIPYAGDCGGGDCVAFDSIMRRDGTGASFVFSSGVSAADFAISDWRLLSEGSAFEATSERCEKDVVPRAPYQALCAALDADAGHRCDPIDQPTFGHCAYYTQNFVSLCVDWFRAL